jgi:hypothetical protein
MCDQFLVSWPRDIEPKLAWPDIQRPWSSGVLGYQVPPDTRVCLKSFQGKCSLVTWLMAWLHPHVKLCDLRFWTLIESCVPLNLFLTKCPACKILQSSSPAMWSLSQLRPRCCLYKNKTNATKIIFYYIKYIWVHNAAPLTEVLATWANAAGNKQGCTTKH